jgi:hypothetical protein
MKLRPYSLIAGSALGASLITALVTAACSSKGEGDLQIPPASGGKSGNSGGAPGTSTGGGSGIVIGGVGGGVGVPSTACSGLSCQQTTCTLGACTQKACSGAGTSTTVSGTVFDPAGKVPLYNVVVYVPSTPVTPFTDGARCDRCDATVLNPLASAITDTKGHFQLKDVPVGDNIPVVIQIGKWRRQITIPQVAACVDTPITDPNLTRLPRNKAEGDIPLIAIATGGFDSMECLPRRMGLDDAEFTTETGAGRIHLYSGADFAEPNGANHPATKAFDPTLNGGAPLTRATSLWGSVDSLKRYDIVILSCEGNPIEQEKPMASREAMYAYASLGGRVFASHWHRIWYSNGPAPVPMVGTWQDRTDPADPATGTINTGFPKGQALADWLVNVGASTTAGQIEIRAPRDNVQAVNTAYATEWIRIPTAGGGGRGMPAGGTAVEYLTFNAPLAVPADQQCGRCVFTDLHVSSTGADVPGTPFPGGCEMRELSPQEKAVEFMLFDLSSCVSDDREPPMPPR